MENIFKRMFDKKPEEFEHDFDLENPIKKADTIMSYEHPYLNLLNQKIILCGYICKKCWKVVWVEEEQKNNLKKEGCIEKAKIVEEPRTLSKKAKRKFDPIRFYDYKEKGDS